MKTHNHTHHFMLKLLVCVSIIFNFQLTDFNSVSAQNWLSRFYHNWLTKPRNVDSTYIYQQSMGFTPSLTSNFSNQSVTMTSVYNFENFKVPLYDENFDRRLDERGNPMYKIYPHYEMIITDKMNGGLSTRGGFILGIGRLGAGWSFELASDSNSKSSTFLFSFRGNKFGLNINYLDFTQKIEEEIRFSPAESSSDTISFTIPTGNRVMRLTVDGYYVINPRRFAYPPGIAGNMVQIKSAGGWMLAGRYLQSEVKVDPNWGFAKFGMAQFSLGCGYSYTWVPFSRAPKDASGRGMYTFFINGTLIPMLTLFNHLTTDPYKDVVGILTRKHSTFCWPTPNLLANATIGFSWSKFYLGVQFNYNVFQFNTRNAIDVVPLDMDYTASGGLYDEASIDVMGVLYEWNIGLKFQVCF